MSHFDDLVQGTLSLIGFCTLCWLFVVCWLKARHALRERRALSQLKAKWEGVAVEQR